MLFINYRVFSKLKPALVSLILCFGLFSSNVVFADKTQSDPFEKVNRASFWVTDQADRFVLRPLSVGYTKITPDWAETGVHNFFTNLTEINSAVNGVFQLKFKVAGRASGRFLINSTIGGLGFFDLASKWGIYRQSEDFGQTLGHWGVPSGPYLFIPLLGPSSVRDSTSLVADSVWRPIRYINHDLTRFELYGLQAIDARSRLLEVEGLIIGDKYSFTRDFYLNFRKKQVADGVAEVVFEEDDFGDDFDDEFDDEFDE